MDQLTALWQVTGLQQLDYGQLGMIVVGLVLLYLAVLAGTLVT